MKEDLIVIISGFIFGILIFILGINYMNKKEHIKQLEQSLTEQIQETEVYRDILEKYQTEGIINE